MAESFTKKSLLVAVIADESTVTGFLLTGIGQRNKNGEQNFMICNKETTDQQLEEGFGKLIARDDIGVILIA
jgi:V-type H+-transporting ATPase subunit F